MNGLIRIDVTDLNTNSDNGCIHHSSEWLVSNQKLRKLSGMTQYFPWQKSYNLASLEWHLKPMDSFGTWQKMKIYIFFVNAEFYRVVWAINALLTVRSEMPPFSGNNQNIKMFGVPLNTLPYVMYIMIICHWAILRYNMSFQTISGRSDGVFWWFPALSEDQEKNLLNSPKTILWL